MKGIEKQDFMKGIFFCIRRKKGGQCSQLKLRNGTLPHTKLQRIKRYIHYDACIANAKEILFGNTSIILFVN